MNSTITDKLGNKYSDLIFDDHARDLIAERCMRFIPNGSNALVLGYQGDRWPEFLMKTCNSVDIVEGNGKFCDRGRSAFQGLPVRVFNSLFETYKADRSYNAIIAAGVLELMDNPLGFMRSIYDWLNPKGILILTTPNARSLHRRIGAIMGFEPNTTTLNDQAIKTGVVKLYDRYEVLSLAKEAGFSIIDCRGMFLKPLPSRELAKLSEPYIKALMSLGDELPDYAKQIVLIATK